MSTAEKPTTPRRRYQRARSQTEKSERRADILAAADALAREAGVEAFSMGALAARAGMAKGTIYLYFQTREEVLLVLYNQQLAHWSAGFLAAVPTPVSDQDFARLFLDSAHQDRLFLELSGRLGSVIEHNVSTERLIDAKRTMRGLLLPVAAHCERALTLPEGSGVALLATLTPFVVGTALIDAGPCLTEPEIPEDVAAMAAVFSGRETFLAGAPALIEEVRRRLAG
jgi:AcrR family transcriptional regulator